MMEKSKKGPAKRWPHCVSSPTVMTTGNGRTWLAVRCTVVAMLVAGQAQGKAGESGNTRYYCLCHSGMLLLVAKRRQRRRVSWQNHGVFIEIDRAYKLVQDMIHDKNMSHLRGTRAPTCQSTSSKNKFGPSIKKEKEKKTYHYRNGKGTRSTPQRHPPRLTLVDEAAVGLNGFHMYKRYMLAASRACSTRLSPRQASDYSSEQGRLQLEHYPSLAA